MDKIIGTCPHGFTVHYRYPCYQCESAQFIEKVGCEMAAGFTGAELAQRIRRLYEFELEQIVKRVIQ